MSQEQQKLSFSKRDGQELVRSVQLNDPNTAQVLCVCVSVCVSLCVCVWLCEAAAHSDFNMDTKADSSFLLNFVYSSMWRTTKQE